jgi:HPr kinase/phosphorylase
MDMLHASAVAFDGQGVLLLGPSGSGKSTLALQLIALGGCLIADDRVLATEKEGRLWLEAPDTIADRIEARGLGLLSCETAPAFASLAVDLTRVETDRLPPERTMLIAGIELPLIYKLESPAFAAMLRVYLAGGRIA